MTQQNDLLTQSADKTLLEVETLKELLQAKEAELTLLNENQK